MRASSGCREVAPGRLDAPECEGLRERTLVVFTSDHGEGFGEHGRFLHGKTFWNELVHVPLLVSGPGIARGVRVGRPVSHVDLVPTLRDLLDVEGLRKDVRGRSLAGLLRRGSAGRRPRGPRPRYLVNEAPEHGGDALVAGRFKLIAWGGGDRKLFDLSADRPERGDLSRERPELLETLTRALHRIRSDDARRWERNAASGDADRLGRVHADTLEELRAMGYVE